MYGLVWLLLLPLHIPVGVVKLSSQSQTERKSMQYAPRYSCDKVHAYISIYVNGSATWI